MTSILKTETQYEFFEVSTLLSRLSASPTFAYLPTFCQVSNKPNKFIFMPHLFLPYCAIWNNNISDFKEWNFCSCNQMIYFVS